jgi:hypothetical protein
MTSRKKLKKIEAEQRKGLEDILKNYETFGRRYDTMSDYDDVVTIRPIDGKYRMDRGGEIVFGKDDRLVAVMHTLRHGLVRREYGVPVKSLMGYVHDGFKPAAREDLGELDENEWPEIKGRPHDPWHPTLDIVLHNTTEDDRYLVVFDDQHNTNFYGPIVRGLDTLALVYAARRRAGHHHDMPVIELTHDTYHHGPYGTTYVPRINVVGWCASAI